MTSEASESIAKRRNPFLAAFLSLLLSGLGQLYNGQIKRSALFLIGDLLLMIAILKFNPATFSIFLIFMLLGAVTISWKIASITDATIQARRRSPLKLAGYNRWYVYLVVWLLIIVSSAYVQNHISRSYETFGIPSASNIPTLMPGDYIMSLDIASADIRRGDMVLFHFPKNPKVTYIKRVIGLPTENIQLKNGQVFVDEKSLAQSHIADFKYPLNNGQTSDRAQYVETMPDGKSFRILLNLQGPLNDTPAVTVPPDHYFVLGDDRNNSLDSRIPSEVGFVPANNIYRKAAYIYWSKDWSRIGKTIE